MRVPKGYGAANKACIRAVARAASCGDGLGRDTLYRHAELVSASYFFKPSRIKTLKQVQGDGEGLSLRPLRPQYPAGFVTILRHLRHQCVQTVKLRLSANEGVEFDFDILPI